MFGFLNIYKPVGMTSHDVVAILRKATKIKQIGHTGTLDPFAQGVLPIAIGKATRLIEYLDDDKEYLAEISFGKSTDTYDCEGRIVSESDSKITEHDVIDGLKKFEGEILQTPPIYSALKVKGKKLYEYARKGEEVEIEPRKVTIEKIELKSFDEEAQKAKVLIKCSKGTYIRSIAHDLGQNLAVGAHLSELIRTQAGKFFVENAVQLEGITIDEIGNKLLKPLDLINLQALEIDEADHKKVMMGQFLEVNKHKSSEVMLNLIQHRINECSCEQSCDPETSSGRREQKIILVYNNNVNAVACIEGDLIKVKKVFT